ncbi:hypothetical protein MICRO11B_160012 [Micrococcus luteus]|nr:hypothetical protein MICRO11B_160012 [Micrococcus luteus]
MGPFCGTEHGSPFGIVGGEHFDGAHLPPSVSRIAPVPPQCRGARLWSGDEAAVPSTASLRRGTAC